MSEVNIVEKVLFQCLPGQKVRNKPESFNVNVKQALIWQSEGVGIIVNIPDPFANLVKETEEEKVAEQEAKAKLMKSDPPIKKK